MLINGIVKVYVIEKSEVFQFEGFFLDLYVYDQFNEVEVKVKGYLYLDLVCNLFMRVF